MRLRLPRVLVLILGFLMIHRLGSTYTPATLLVQWQVTCPQRNETRRLLVLNSTIRMFQSRSATATRHSRPFPRGTGYRVRKHRNRYCRVANHLQASDVKALADSCHFPPLPPENPGVGAFLNLRRRRRVSCRDADLLTRPG